VTVLGIDSAELTGFAVVTRPSGGREELARSGVVTIRTAADVEAAVTDLTGRHAPDVVAIEEPFAHPKQGPVAGMALARLLGRWLQAFERRGCTCVTIPACMWQPAILGGRSGLIGPRATRPERKAAAQTWVKATFGVELAEDEADAICMASYVLRSATWKRRAA
jgi:Holliday junction resolvasome RuvABC endonuclease subunit